MNEFQMTNGGGMKRFLAIVILMTAVCGTAISSEAEDSVEVIVPDMEEYTFDTVLTEEIWEGKDFSYSGNWLFHDEDNPWFLGSCCTEAESTFYRSHKAICDVEGNIDTLYEIISYPGMDELPDYPTIVNCYTVERYEHLEPLGDTIFFMSDTGLVIDKIYQVDVFDSIVIKPIFEDKPPWKFTEAPVRPILIGENGWAFVEIDHRYSIADSLYPDWEYAISHNGQIDVQIELPGIIRYPRFREQRNPVTIRGGYFAVYSEATISIFDTAGNFVFSKTDAGADFDLLADGSIISLIENEGEISILRNYPDREVSYELPVTPTRVLQWKSAYNHLVISGYISGTYNSIVYFFDTSDSLEFVWSDTLENSGIYSIGIHPDGNPWGSVLEDPDRDDDDIWSIQMFSSTDGELVWEWPEDVVYIYHGQDGDISFHAEYIQISGQVRKNPRTYINTFLLKATKGGE